MIDVRNRITPDLLLRLGFTETENKFHSGQSYKLKLPYYPFEILMTIGDHVASNPNCGIVSLHQPTQEIPGIPKDLYNKKKWSDADHKRAQNHKIKCKAWTQPIAWYVNTPERLRAIILSLTAENI